MSVNTANSAVFLQARLDSSRLPAKALFDLAGQPMVVRCMESLRRLPADCYCLLTDQASAPILAPFAELCGWQIFAGPRDDVLSRFVQAADHFGVSHIWRATADNPAVSVDLSLSIIAEYRARGGDYCVASPVPHGSCIEAVSAQALRQVQLVSQSAFDHEHVCPGVYKHPEQFKVAIIRPDPILERPDLRVTVDTIEDYLKMRQIFCSLYRGTPIALAALISHFDLGRDRQ